MELLVGTVGRVHGLRGDVFVEVRTDEPDRRFAPGTTFTTPRGVLTVGAYRWHGQRLLLSFVGVSDRSAAEAIKGVELLIAVPADERPDHPEEFYDHQLVGLTATTTVGDPLGEVVEVLHLPAQDVLVVRRPAGDVLIPFVSDIVATVDLEAAVLVVVPQPGLLDDLDYAPVEAAPVEAAPVEAAPVEVAPVEAAPVEAAADPLDGSPPR